MTEAVDLAEVPTIEEALALVTPALKARIAAHQRLYRQRPGVRAAYLAKQRTYRQRPEVKAHARAYRQRPEIKARHAAYMRPYMRIYRQRQRTP